MPAKSHPTLTISLPLPCDQVWEDMIPLPCGRFCSQCNKNLIDFTLLTDEQLALLLYRRQGAHLCGRFLDSQLNRPLPLVLAPPESPVRKLAKSIAAVMLAIPGVYAGTAGARQAEPCTRHSVSDAAEPAAPALIKVHGTISDATTGQPLEGMEIILEGAATCYSDEQGRYTLYMPAAFAGRQLQLSARYQPGCAVETPYTIIPPETLAPAAPGTYQADLFRYMLVDLGKTEISEPPLHNTYTGISATAFSYPAKPGLWKRFISIFKRK